MPYDFAKAACDFGIAPYFRKCAENNSLRRGDISITPDKRNVVERNLGEGDVPYCNPRHGRQVRNNSAGDAAEERKERHQLHPYKQMPIGAFDRLRHRELRRLREISPRFLISPHPNFQL